MTSSFPPGWSTVPLGSVCERAETRDPRRMPEAEFEYVDVSSVDRDSLRITGSTRYRGAAAPSRARKLIRSEDVVLATVRPTLRRVAQVPEELDGQFASTAFCVIRADRGKAHPKFLYYAVSGQDFIGGLGGLERGANYPAVTDRNVLAQTIPLPPLPEQRAIAAVLSKIQAAVEVQERIVRTLRELKTATMTKLLNDGLPGERSPGDEQRNLPEGWEIVRLGGVTEFLSGGTPSKRRLEWWRGPIPWASPKDMKTPRLRDTMDHLTDEAVRAGSRTVPPGVVFIVVRGMVLAKDVPVALTEAPMAFNQDMKAIVPGPRVRPDFLLYALSASKTRMNRFIGQAAHGTRRIGSASLEDFEIGLPSNEEQGVIARTLGSLESAELAAEARLKVLRRLFEAVLPKLITGQLRTPRPLWVVAEHAS